MTAAQVCRDAAQYLRDHGWTQDEYGIVDGPCCVRGAISMVTTGDPMRINADTGKASLAVAAGLRTGSLTLWNDANDRTADEVIAQLEATADRLDAEAQS